MKANLTSGGVLRVSVALVVVLAVLGGGLAIFLNNSHKATAGSSEHENGDVEEPAIAVKTVHPRHDKYFTMVEKRPADVRPYFEANLETRVPGIVSWLPADVGTEVKKNEELVRVAVPDLLAREKQRDAAWQLAKAQVMQREAAIKTAEADHKAAQARSQAARARLKSDVAYREFREKQQRRYVGLLADRAIDARLVDEQEDRLQAAVEAVNAAREAVASADAQVEASQARITQANADLEEAKQNVQVTEAELGYAKAMLGYATIIAPFDGVIVRRNVDPGFFVQNAGDGHATPLLTIQRNDIVTIVMRVPDNFAPFVTPETEAIFETPSLPGVKIHGKVTRYPPSLINPERDRTMLVEVDLWNRSRKEFEEKLKDPKSKFVEGLKKGMPGDPKGGLPIVPQVEGKLGAGRKMYLMPGMFGEMTLVLRKFANVHLLPSSAIINKGGYTYIYVVKDGKAHLQPVKEQIDDGKLVKVELLNAEGEVVGDLTGKEEVIISNQGELDEGQPINPSLVENWKSLAPGGDPNEKH
jgi:HlyD family secretion protein